jgi:hypothetical protein
VDLIEHLQRQRLWSEKTFGPGNWRRGVIRGTGLWKVALARNGLLRPDVRGSNDVSPLLG